MSREWKMETGVVDRGGNAGMAYTVAICPCGWRHRRNGRDEKGTWQEAVALHPSCIEEDDSVFIGGAFATEEVQHE